LTVIQKRRGRLPCEFEALCAAAEDLLEGQAELASHWRVLLFSAGEEVFVVFEIEDIGDSVEIYDEYLNPLDF
jgi:hypothetical protein